jgi:hypothetical protein
VPRRSLLSRSNHAIRNRKIFSSFVSPGYVFKFLSPAKNLAQPFSCKLCALFVSEFGKGVAKMLSVRHPFLSSKKVKHQNNGHLICAFRLQSPSGDAESFCKV